MSPQLDPVAEIESVKTHVHQPGSPSFLSLGQRHQSVEASKLSPTTSPRKENEHHGEHSHHKKSLFSKMKDKAKKLQHSLSGRRRHDEEGDATMSPLFGRSADHQVRDAGGYETLSPRDKYSKDHKVREEGEAEEEEEDPEYLGAPMYESKKAPEELKATARKHPRETHVITETNVLSVLPAKHNPENQQKDCTGSNTEKSMIAEKNVLSAHSNTTATVTDSVTNQEPISPSKTVTEAVTETLAPAYAKVSDVTHAITKKIQDMAFPESTINAEPKCNDLSEINTKVWDKGVSMKEYISQKFTPGEDDKELFRVISNAISPRKVSSEAPKFSGATNSSANTNEIVKEENHGKMLQPN